MSYSLHSPHDSYFVNMMEIKSLAASFFTAQLPNPIREALDWTTLQLAESARRHPAKKTTYTDITYQCLTKSEAIPIFLHAEQQRSYDPTMLERILRYNLGLFSQHRKQGNKKLPIIINFVVYNTTKTTNQPYPANAWEYFELPWMAQLLKDRYFYCLNLKKEPDEALTNHGLCGVMELLLKRAGDANFIQWLSQYPGLVEAMKLKDIFELSLSYTLAVGKAKATLILDTFSALYPQYQETIMTAARQLKKEGILQGKKEGILQGRKEGILEGKKETARNMLLRLHLDLDTVEKATQLPKDELEKILQENK
jgi:predicted transposase YdaD